MLKLILLLGCALLSGCVGAQYYVHPIEPDASPVITLGRGEPYLVSLTVVGEQNGEFNEPATRVWTRLLTQSFKLSGVIKPTLADFRGQLKVKINDVGNRSEAAAKGLVASLSLGAVGVGVADNYIVTIQFKDASGRVFTADYNDHLYTTVGATSGPEKMQKVDGASALSVIADNIEKNAIASLQREGAFDSLTPKPAPSL